MRIERNHNFTADEAKERLEALTTYWATRYGIQPQWSGHRLTVTGKVKAISFQATMNVEDRRVVCEAKIGFLAERLGARPYIEKKLGEYLDPKTPVADLPRG